MAGSRNLKGVFPQIVLVRPCDIIPAGEFLCCNCRKWNFVDFAPALAWWSAANGLRGGLHWPVLVRSKALG